MAHREDIKEMIRKIGSLKNSSVIDWGRGTKPITKYLEVKEYFGIDKLDHVGADLVTDMTIALSLKEFDVAFCMEVMEHVGEPAKLLENIYNNLKKGGMFFLSVPFLYPVHSNEDYWRFTNQGLKFLLERAGFEVIEIIATEGNAGWLAKARRV